EITAARRHLAAAEPHARRIESRVIASLALARSMDAELRGALPEALTILTAGFGGDAEAIEEVEDLLADAVRRATKIGDLGIARALAGRAAALAAESQIPHRQASALYCQGLLDGDATQLLEAAQRYSEAGQLLPTAKALEAAADGFAIDDRRRSR